MVRSSTIGRRSRCSATRQGWYHRTDSPSRHIEVFKGKKERGMHGLADKHIPTRMLKLTRLVVGALDYIVELGILIQVNVMSLVGKRRKR